MALQVYQGTFTANTSTGNQVVSGIVDQASAAFTPKALLVWTTYQTATGFTDSQVFQMGVCDGDLNQGSSYSFADDNTSPNDTDRAFSTTQLVLIRNVAGTTQHAGAVTAVASGQFTINWTIVSATAAVFHFVAFGGTDCYFHAGNTNMSGVADTTLPFNPTGLLTIQYGDSAGNSCNYPNVGVVGFMEDNATIVQGSAATNVENGQTVADTWRYQHTSFGSSILTGSTGAVYNTLTGTRLGWVLNSGSVSSVSMLYLAFGGQARVAVGSGLQPTSTGTQAVTGAGFAPAWVGVFSVGQTAQTTVQTETRLSFGAMTAAAQGSCWVGNADAANPSVAARRHTTSIVVTMGTPAATGASSTVEAEASVASLDAGGFTFELVDGRCHAAGVCLGGGGL